MTEERVRAECAKLGWILDRDWTTDGSGKVDRVVYRPQPGVPHERMEIGRGATAHAAYRAACQHVGITRF